MMVIAAQFEVMFMTSVGGESSVNSTAMHLGSRAMRRTAMVTSRPSRPKGLGAAVPGALVWSRLSISMEI